MKKIVLSLFFILLIQQVFAVNVQIQVQSEFHERETLSFDYRFISSIDEKVVYTPFIDCPKMMTPLLKMNELDLLANQMEKYTFEGDIVDSDVESQVCTASIQIHKPIKELISKNFSIDTLLSFDFNLLLDKKIFIQGEDIKIDYNSPIENLNVMAKLYLGENEKQISLPYSFKAEQLGTYELEVTASKEGYKTIIKEEKFGVIKKNVEIPYAEKIVVSEKSLFDFILNLFKRTEYISCSDSDDGLNSEQFGEVEVNYIEGLEEKIKIFKDKCYDGMFDFFRGDLREFYCREDNQFAFKYVKCENGCENGRCK